MEEKTENLPSVTIDRQAYNTLWQAADDIERRFLSLALRLEMDAHGWTVDGYTDTELLDLMQYKPSSVSRKRLKQIIARYRLEKVLDTHPPRGHRRRLWFSFVTGSTSSRLSQQTMNVILDHNGEDRGSQLPGAAVPPATAGESPLNVIPDPTKSDPRSRQTGSPITSEDTDLDLDDDQKVISTNIDQSDQADAKADLLSAVGVSLKAFSETALMRFGEMATVEIRTVIENALAGKRLGKVKKPQAFIATCIENHEGIVSTAYLDEWHEQEQVREAQQREQAEQAARDAYLNSPEYLAEVEARRQAQAAAAETERLQQTQAKARHQALIATLEPITERRILPDGSSHMSYADCWLAALGTFQLQLHRATFNSWIAGAEALGTFIEHGQRYLVVATVNAYAKDWLEQRLYRLVQGVFSTVAREEIHIRFVVQPQEPRIYAFKPLPDGLPGFTDRLAS